jgi:hypothetical protein
MQLNLLSKQPLSPLVPPTALQFSLTDQALIFLATHSKSSPPTTYSFKTSRLLQAHSSSYPRIIIGQPAEPMLPVLNSFSNTRSKSQVLTLIKPLVHSHSRLWLLLELPTSTMAPLFHLTVLTPSTDSLVTCCLRSSTVPGAMETEFGLMLFLVLIVLGWYLLPSLHIWLTLILKLESKTTETTHQFLFLIRDLFSYQQDVCVLLN